MSLNQYLLSLPSSEPHHVCVTGNHAAKLMQSIVSHDGHGLTDFLMESKLEPSTECMAKH